MCVVHRLAAPHGGHAAADNRHLAQRRYPLRPLSPVRIAT
jgi:hypothetical protein